MPMMLGQPSGGRDYRTRLFVAAGFVLVMLLVLVGRLYHLQITRGEEYREKSIDNFVKESRVPSDRGSILDNRGRILVDSRPSYNVTLTPAFCQPKGAPKDHCVNEIIPRVATYLSLTAEEIERVTNQFRRARGLERFRDFTVKVDADLDSLDRLEANRMELDGIEVVAAPHRSYRYGPLAAHVLGYMNEISADELDSFQKQSVAGYQLGDYIGRRGVERKFESSLKGKDGRLKAVVDAKGRKLPGSDHLLKGVDRLLPSQPGHNLVLSLSLPLQQAAERAFPGQAGAVVVVEAQTGFLLTVMSKPAYDPNKLSGRITRAELRALSEDPLEPLIFRVAQQHYHPGSTFKVVTALAALEKGVVSRHSNVFCGGGYNLGKRRWRCHKDSGHGGVDLHRAIAWSCDTFFYQASDRMGIDPIADISRRLGLGRPPGLELSPEVPGVVPSTEYHNRVTPGGYTKGLALNTSIGQGDNNVSPLQLAMAYAALGNGGKLFKPQVVRRIEDWQGHTVQAMEPILVGTLGVKPQNLEMVLEGLHAVVNEPGGTAYSKRLKDIAVSGKTGTAQVVTLGEKRLKTHQMEYFSRDHAWFAAFAPSEEPEIAVVVLNEHGGHGGSDAAPTAMAVIQEYFRIKAEEQAVRNGARPPEPVPAPAPAAEPPPGPDDPRRQQLPDNATGSREPARPLARGQPWS